MVFYCNFYDDDTEVTKIYAFSLPKMSRSQMDAINRTEEFIDFNHILEDTYKAWIDQGGDDNMFTNKIFEVNPKNWDSIAESFYGYFEEDGHAITGVKEFGSEQEMLDYYKI